MMSLPLSPKKKTTIVASSSSSSSEDLGLSMFNFHVDLVQESQNHMKFLRQLHASGTTLQRPSRRSLHRYMNCWLPLVAKFTNRGQEQQSQFDNNNNQQQLIPPSDIAWLWHCHRLAPMHYERYVRCCFGGVILEANPPFCCQEFQLNDDDLKDNTAMEESCNNSNISSCSCSSSGKVAVFTKRAWLEMFPNEPFFLEEECSESDDHFMGSNTTTNMEENDRVGGFDVIGSTQRQKDFLFQVSGCCFQDVSFLKDGVNKYYKFLSLKPSTTTTNSLPLVPTFQIDLIWHTHILVSLEMYHKECLLIRGERFHHDDSMDDRTPGAILDRAFQYTAQMWKETYGEDYVVPGAMYRGESPASYYDCNWQPMNIGMAKQLMAGSNSSGRAGTEWQVPKRGASCFIPAKPKSTTKGLNSNPQMNGFIFGKGIGGAGYYSMETRDAYKILSNRLQAIGHQKHAKYQNYECSHCLCFFRLSSRQVEAKEAIWKEVQDIYDMVAQVEARLAAMGPYEPLDPAVIATHYKRLFGERKDTPQENNNKNKSADATSTVADPHPLTWYPASYCIETNAAWTSSIVNTAGGCGGGAMGGGGAACGAAACGGGGGGGCGGGGCGGGGCGGGGCGGS